TTAGPVIGFSLTLGTEAAKAVVLFTGFSRSEDRLCADIVLTRVGRAGGGGASLAGRPPGNGAHVLRRPARRIPIRIRPESPERARLTSSATDQSPGGSRRPEGSERSPANRDRSPGRTAAGPRRPGPG